MRGQGGAALLEFAIAWPVTLLLVIGTVQFAVWGAEAYAVRQAALAGARAGSGLGGTPALARSVAVDSLRPSLVGVQPAGWCPGQPGHPRLWVCVFWQPASVQVRVGGSVPALVTLLPGAGGLPVGADVTLPREVFQ